MASSSRSVTPPTRPQSPATTTVTTIPLSTTDQGSQAQAHHGRHSCPECESEILEAYDKALAEVSERRPNKFWRWTLKHRPFPNYINVAATRGCPLFLWLGENLKRSLTPGEQLARTSIVVEFTLGERSLNNVPAWQFRAENISSAAVLVTTPNYSWQVGRKFDVVSWFYDPSAKYALARSIVGDISSPASLSQVRHRLAFCLQHHDACRDVKPSSKRPIRFLDTGTEHGGDVVLRTLNDGSTAPYVTLSYVWGKDQPSKTTLNNLAKHESGISAKTLPKTIQDAVRVTQLIGVSLLWVDSLCIVQDDPVELGEEIANMSDYYGNALFTLSAASAWSCDEGFLGRDPLPASLHSDDITFTLPISSPHWDGSGHIDLRPSSAPKLEPIDDRAWTLQEGLLSTRLVSFCFDTITWSCPAAEYGAGRISDLRKEFGRKRIETLRGWNQPWENRAIYDRIRHQSPSEDGTLMRGLLETSQQLRFINDGLLYLLGHWDDIVCEYSARQLSKPTDRLLAISGVASEFSRRFRPPISSKPNTPGYLAGLWWSQLLPWQLLWMRKAPIDPSTTAEGDEFVAPSWSWASRSGAVDRSMQRRILEYYRAQIIHVLHEAYNEQEAGSSSASTDKQSPPVEVIECRIELKNRRAPFGAVASGHIIVKGPVSDVERAQQRGIQLHFDNGEPGVSAYQRQQQNDVRGLILLHLVYGKESIKTGIEPITPLGLILAKNHVVNTWQRVGVYSLAPAKGADFPPFRWHMYTDWSKMTVKII